MNCIHCHTPIYNLAQKQCHHCNEPLSGTCSHCGSTMTYSALRSGHCYHCGTEIPTAFLHAWHLNSLNSLPPIWIKQEKEIEFLVDIMTGTLLDVTPKDMSHVFIPDYITTIGKSAFQHCSFLLSVHCASSLQKIDSYAFADCSNLEEFCASTVEEISSFAFFNCLNFKYFYRDSKKKSPEYGTIQAEESFPFCHAHAFHLSGFEETYLNYIHSLPTSNQDRNGIFTPASKSETVCTAIYVPSVEPNYTFIVNLNDLTVETILPHATSDSDSPPSILHFPYGVRHIGFSACEGNKNLVEVHIPPTVISIDERAFACCDNLEIVNMTSSVELFCDFCFAHCPKLKPIIRNAPYPTIMGHAFDGTPYDRANSKDPYSVPPPFQENSLTQEEIEASLEADLEAILAKDLQTNLLKILAESEETTTTEK